MASLTPTLDLLELLDLDIEVNRRLLKQEDWIIFLFPFPRFYLLMI